LIAALAVALVFGAVPLGWCATPEGAGWVLLGDHLCAGGCVVAAPACSCGDDLCGSGAPQKECCQDEAGTPLVSMGADVVLPAAIVASLAPEATAGGEAADAIRRTADDGEDDPSDARPDLATVVLLR
jgi:hypothetical protein